MTIVATLAVRGETDAVASQVAFHLAAGVDHVVVTGFPPDEEVAATVEPYERAGVVSRYPGDPGLGDDELHTRMARQAAVELGAEWIVPLRDGEFWWPRGESLSDVLEAIPGRYDVVQALVRVFVPAEGDGFFVTRMTARTRITAKTAPPLDLALRRAYRAHRDVTVGAHEAAGARPLAPVRGSYPIEVLAFPVRSVGQLGRQLTSSSEVGSLLEADLRDAHRKGRLGERYEELVRDVPGALERGELVSDTRLADLLDAIGSEVPPARVPIRVPDVVDDAAYAVEAAALGEADLAALSRHLNELERRIVALEQGLWPRVVRRLSRLASRTRGG